MRTKYILFYILCHCLITEQTTMSFDNIKPIRVGGLTDVQQPDETVFEVMKAIRPELERKLGKTFCKYEPVSCKTQLVNGINYFIKIDIGEPHFLHVRVHRSFAGEHTFAAVHTGKQLEDEIDYFQDDNI